MADWRWRWRKLASGRRALARASKSRPARGPEFALFHEGPSRILVSTSQPENVLEIARKIPGRSAAHRCYDERAVTNRLRFGNFAGLRPDGVSCNLGKHHSNACCTSHATITLCASTHPFDDKLHEECGVFAIYGHPEASNLTYLGLYALQHRGQESAGIATSDHREIRCFKSMGHVADIFTPEQIACLPGDHGHRAHALFHGRRHGAAERAAFLGGLQQGTDRGGAQRQHHQRRRACGASWSARDRSFRPPATPK